MRVHRRRGRLRITAAKGGDDHQKIYAMTVALGRALRRAAIDGAQEKR